MSEQSFHRVGVNYQGTDSTKWAADKAYFKSIKSPNAQFPIRIMSAPNRLPVPFSLAPNNGSNYAYRLAMVEYFAADPDFRVIFSANYGPLTNRDAQGINDSLVALATYMQGRGFPVEFQLGNELEGTFGIAFAGVSLSQTAGVATLVVASDMNIQVGDTITIYGSNRTQYNATHTITAVLGPRTFQFNIDPATTNPGGGTYYAVNMSVTQLNAAIRTWAANVKAVYSLGPVTYGAFNPTVAGLKPFDDWAANGIGAMDQLSIHTYPNSTGRPRRVNPFPTDVAPVVNALGVNKVYVSEMNIDSGSITNLSTEAAISGMRNLLNGFHALGIDEVIIWSWDTNLAMKLADGSFHPLWALILSDNKRIGLANVNGMTRLTAASRPTSASRRYVNNRVAV